jgi:hypothetical protein
LAALGDLIYRAAALWTRLAGNTSATRKFLSQTGTGAVSAAPAWNQVTDADLSTSNITTNNVTIAKHGFAPILPNDATKYLDGTGAYTVPAGSGTGTVTTTGSPASGNLTKFSGATSITNADLTGDVTTSGTVATVIANAVVTLAKIANAAANSKLLGSGASGSGSSYTELTLGTGLSMSGTTLNATSAAGSFVQLAQIVTTGSATTVDFTSISGAYSALKVMGLAQDTAAGTGRSVLRLMVNNDSTAANYTSTQRAGAQNGAALVSALASSTKGIQVGSTPNSGTTNSAGTTEVTLIGYAGTTFQKAILSLSGEEDDGANGTLINTVSRWKSTAAITRLTFQTDGTAFTDGSTFTLYGLV